MKYCHSLYASSANYTMAIIGKPLRDQFNLHQLYWLHSGTGRHTEQQTSCDKTTINPNHWKHVDSLQLRICSPPTLHRQFDTVTDSLFKHRTHYCSSQRTTSLHRRLSLASKSLCWVFVCSACGHCACRNRQITMQGSVSVSVSVSDCSLLLGYR